MSLYELERSGDVQELIRLLREAEEARIRARAAESLGSFGDHVDREDIVSALLEAAQSDDENVSATAIDALAEFGGDAIEELVGEMAGVDLGGDAADWVTAKAYVEALDADVPELRRAAAPGLGELETTDAVEPLTRTFEDPDPRVRARSARASGLIGDPRATEPLSGLLEDPHGGVRREAAEALGYLGSRQALQALFPLYEDEDERVRRVAVGAFGNFENDRPVSYLVDALEDEVATVRRRAVYSLVELLSNVPTERSHEIRETVVDELAARDEPSVVVPLVEILEESSQSPQRRNTAWLLGRVTEEAGRDRVTDALIDALADDDRMVRQFAATSLAELGGDGVEDRLLPIVKDDEESAAVRAQAVFTLGKVGGERSRQALDALLEDTDDEQLRRKAFSAISKLGGRE
jgi:HEAT repeat protein